MDGEEALGEQHTGITGTERKALESSGSPTGEPRCPSWHMEVRFSDSLAPVAFLGDTHLPTPVTVCG